MNKFVPIYNMDIIANIYIFVVHNINVLRTAAIVACHAKHKKVTSKIQKNLL